MCRQAYFVFYISCREVKYYHYVFPDSGIFFPDQTHIAMIAGCIYDDSCDHERSIQSPCYDLDYNKSSLFLFIVVTYMYMLATLGPLVSRL